MSSVSCLLTTYLLIYHIRSDQIRRFSDSLLVQKNNKQVKFGYSTHKSWPTVNPLICQILRENRGGRELKCLYLYQCYFEITSPFTSFLLYDIFYIYVYMSLLYSVGCNSTNIRTSVELQNNNEWFIRSRVEPHVEKEKKLVRRTTVTLTSQEGFTWQRLI